MSLASGRPSLPPVGTVPVPVSAHSPRAAAFLDDAKGWMIRSNSEVDWKSLHDTPGYMDPLLRTKKSMLDFCVQMWLAGMVGWTAIKIASISVFFVFKREEDGTWILRPVWDLRKVNHFFQRPPRFALGSQSAISELDLSETVRQG